MASHSQRPRPPRAPPEGPPAPLGWDSPVWDSDGDTRASDAGGPGDELGLEGGIEGSQSVMGQREGSQSETGQREGSQSETVKGICADKDGRGVDRMDEARE